MAEIVLNVI